MSSIYLGKIKIWKYISERLRENIDRVEPAVDDLSKGTGEVGNDVAQSTDL